MGGQVLFTHRSRGEQHFQLDIKGARVLIALVQQVGQRLRITLWTCRLGLAERFQSFGSHHPRRDAGNKAFRQKRPQRLVLPGLDIPRRPVVEQAETSDMLGGIANGNRIAYGIALADPDAQLQLIVQARAWAKGRLGLAGRQGLAFRASHLCTRGANGRGTAVVANGHVLVVRQQRVIGAEQFADVLRMFDADVEVGVVIDLGRQVHLAIGGTVQHLRLAGLQLAAFGQQFQQALAQGNAGATAQLKKRVQLPTRSGFDGAPGFTFKRVQRGMQVENRIANRHATARCRAIDTEHAQGQVLQGEIRVTIGRGYPAAGLRWLSHGLSPVRVEGGGQRGPARVISRLQLRAFQGELGRAQHLAGLEHERHGVIDLVRRQVGVDGLGAGLAIRAVGAHATVQRCAARQEAFGLGVVGALDQAHVFVHQIAVKPRRTEGVLGHHPAWRENHEVEVGQAVHAGRRGQYREDRRVRVIETHRANGVETAQVVFVRHIVAVPGDHVER